MVKADRVTPPPSPPPGPTFPQQLPLRCPQLPAAQKYTRMQMQLFRSDRVAGQVRRGSRERGGGGPGCFTYICPHMQMPGQAADCPGVPAPDGRVLGTAGAGRWGGPGRRPLHVPGTWEGVGCGGGGLFPTHLALPLGCIRQRQRCRGNPGGHTGGGSQALGLMSGELNGVQGGARSKWVSAGKRLASPPISSF